VEISIPAIPIGVVTLLSFFIPLLIPLVTNPAWTKSQRKVVAIAVSILVAATSLIGYYLITHETLPSWPLLVLLAIVVAQASYTLVLKGVADRIDRATSS
jgi:Na+/melibiose symporter-like transporter